MLYCYVKMRKPLILPCACTSNWWFVLCFFFVFVARRISICVATEVLIIEDPCVHVLSLRLNFYLFDQWAKSTESLGSDYPSHTECALKINKTRRDAHFFLGCSSGGLQSHPTMTQSLSHPSLSPYYFGLHHLVFARHPPIPVKTKKKTIINKKPKSENQVVASQSSWRFCFVLGSGLSGGGSIKICVAGTTQLRPRSSSCINFCDHPPKFSTGKI